MVKEISIDKCKIFAICWQIALWNRNKAYSRLLLQRTRTPTIRAVGRKKLELQTLFLRERYCTWAKFFTKSLWNYVAVMFRRFRNNVNRENRQIIQFKSQKTYQLSSLTWRGLRDYSNQKMAKLRHITAMERLSLTSIEWWDRSMQQFCPTCNRISSLRSLNIRVHPQVVWSPKRIIERRACINQQTASAFRREI